MALTLDGLAIDNGILTVESEAQALAPAPIPKTRTKAARRPRRRWHVGIEGAVEFVLKGGDH